MDTDGIATVDVQIGDHNFKWDMYVAPIGDNVLLGCDIVDEMNITINSKKGIQIDGNWINCDVERRTDDKIARVQLAENVTVPANSEIILPGKTIYPENIDTRYSMLQPIVEDNRKIIVAQSLLDPFGKILPIRLVNLENHPVRLRRNYLFGELHTVEDIQDPGIPEVRRINSDGSNETHICKVHKLRRSHEDGSTTDLYIPQEWLNNNQKDKSDSIEVKGKQKNKAEFPMLPDHLQELFEKSCENIPDIQTREKLAEMLIKNKQAFASSKTE